jgi:hypothetical protein
VPSRDLIEPSIDSVMPSDCHVVASRGFLTRTVDFAALSSHFVAPRCHFAMLRSDFAERSVGSVEPRVCLAEPSVNPAKTRRFSMRGKAIFRVGKAFYDIDNSGIDKRNNRRTYDNNLAVWEIYPVMQLLIGNPKVSAAPPQTQPQATPQITATATPIVPTPTAAPQEFVTITQPVTIQIPYGTTVLQPGLKLPVVSRDTSTVRVRYTAEIHRLPFLLFRCLVTRKKWKKALTIRCRCEKRRA